MELINEFSVAVPVARAWEVLSDVETIAPCLPGATLEEVEGESYRGVVKVKVGPITAQYKGSATFVERDADARRMVLKADGREVKGQGKASALISAELSEVGPSSTTVRVTTDLNISGRAMQFGRGVLGDVSAKLMDQFADNLSTTVLAPSQPAQAGQAAQAAAPQSEPTSPAAAGAPIDLVGTAGGSIAKRVVPAVGVLVLLLLVVRALRGRR